MPLTYTALDVISDALIEVNMLAPGETPDGEVGSWAFRQLNYLLDVWAARSAYVYATEFNVYTLVPNLNPHTIGPTGTFVITQRPVKIVSANLLLNGSSTLVDCPINVRDDKWYAANQTKNITSTVPTDLYYSAGWENGQLFFWPVPSVGRDVRLEIWTALAQYDQVNDPLAGPAAEGTLPQGYRAAMTFTLAQMLCPGGAKELHPVLAEKARQANKAVFGNNDQSPRIATQDFGMPKSGRRGQFNYGFGGPPGLGPR
jgi:hypothetical protein